jgi:sortase A
MGKSRTRPQKRTNKDIIGGHWLPNLMIWLGLLLMLTGGVIAYPTLEASLAPQDAESLEFNVTLAPPVAAAPLTPTPALAETNADDPSPTAQPVEATPTAPPPITLPETELVAAQETATPTPIQATEVIIPEATPEPTATPQPTPTQDPASLVPVRLVIPAIELDAPIVEVGWQTEEVNGDLVSSWIVPNAFASGWHTTSALPGEPGNTVLNGHHNIYGEVFRDLKDLEPGDEIVVYTGVTPHYYAVTERHILKEKYESAEVRLENAQFILPTDDERLTMVTCWPYTNNTHRLIIVAMPVQPTPAPTPMLE